MQGREHKLNKTIHIEVLFFVSFSDIIIKKKMDVEPD